MLILSNATTALRGSASVENLQRALKGYAQVTGNALLDPGVIDGVIGPKTLQAVSAVLPHIVNSINKTLSTALIVTLPLVAADPGMKDKATRAIEQAAPEMTAAIIALTVKATTGSAPTPPKLPQFQFQPIKATFITPNALPSSTGSTPGAGLPVGPDPYGSMMPGDPWYKTWWGMTAIGLGAVSAIVVALSVLRK